MVREIEPTSLLSIDFVYSSEGGFLRVQRETDEVARCPSYASRDTEIVY